MKDKATAFKNELAGSTTNKILCKAASHEVAGPKKKHVDCKFCVCEFGLRVTSLRHFEKNLAAS